jgi:hypothetical protein
MWFARQGSSGSNGAIGRITTPATTASTSPLVAAVLPSSRSAQVGNAATAFATIINSGSTALSGCAIAPVTSVPAGFAYQTTDPATNALTGTPNTPAAISAGKAQPFVVALTPNAPVVPTEVMFGFSCNGVDAAPSTIGLNTLLYSASATPVLDIVALAPTAQNDGIVHVTGSPMQGAFAVATANVGASGQVTASAGTGATNLPQLGISLCQTDQSGQCLATPSSSVTFTSNAGATPTVAIFVTANSSVSPDFANNRVFDTFGDAGGAIRGSSSVEVETQSECEGPRPRDAGTQARLQNYAQRSKTKILCSRAL